MMITKTTPKMMPGFTLQSSLECLGDYGLFDHKVKGLFKAFLSIKAFRWAFP